MRLYTVIDIIDHGSRDETEAVIEYGEVIRALKYQLEEESSKGNTYATRELERCGWLKQGETNEK